MHALETGCIIIHSTIPLLVDTEVVLPRCFNKQPNALVLTFTGFQEENSAVREYVDFKSQ